MLLQGILQGKLNQCFIFKKIATKLGLNMQLQLFLTNKVTKASIVLYKISYHGKREAVLMPLVILVTI